MSDAEITARFERFGYHVLIDQIAFTTESVEDFYRAREDFWTRGGRVKLYEPPGLLIIEKAQPKPNQPTRDIIVLSLGYARAVMGVLSPKSDVEIPRYARDMD
jgi:hypothetical protein